MRTLGLIEPQLLVVAAFSRHEAALAWAREQLQAAFGPVALASGPFAFSFTAYYERTMGPGLTKQLWAFRDLIPMDGLASVKRRTIDMEADLATSGRFPEPRPLNLDPGYLGLGKFILATTKDQAHRLYLRDGVFAEVTLNFRDGRYHPNPWTYPDYAQPAVLEFLGRAREFYWERRDLQSGSNESR